VYSCQRCNAFCLQSCSKLHVCSQDPTRCLQQHETAAPWSNALTMSFENSGFFSRPTVHINTAKRDPTANCRQAQCLVSLKHSKSTINLPHLNSCAGDRIWKDLQNLLVVSAVKAKAPQPHAPGALVNQRAISLQTCASHVEESVKSVPAGEQGTENKRILFLGCCRGDCKALLA